MNLLPGWILNARSVWLQAAQKGRVGRDFLADEAGVSAIEYALLASLIAIVALVGIALLGVNLGVLWDQVADKVAEAMS